MPAGAGFLIAAALLILAAGLASMRRTLLPARMRGSVTPADLGLRSEDVALVTRDRKTLRGWLITPEKARAVIICCHGYPADRSNILPAVRFLADRYTLLLFDFRGHGESDAGPVTFGVREVWDVEAALEYLKKRPDTREKPVGIWGYSMGAAVAILSAARHPEITAVVSDSAFASFPEMVTEYYRDCGPLKHLISPPARLFARVVFRADPAANSPETHVGGIRAPILIIHSPQDDMIPFSHAERIFARANEPKRLLQLPGTHTGHESAFRADYERAVGDWFDTHLADGPRGSGR